jgi:DNA (cytosine-5)-methyltransferase 1
MEVSAIQTWKPRKPSWPLERWGKYRQQYTYTCSVCRHEVDPLAFPAYTAIDWSDLGPTLGERLKPLAPKTIDRIRRGLEKFKDWPAVVIPAAGNTFEREGQTRAKHVGMPLFTQTGTAQHGLASMPFLVEMRGGGSVRAGQHPVVEPMHTVTAGGMHHGFVTTMVGTHDAALNQNRMLDVPLTTVTSRGHHGLVTDAFTMPISHAGGDRVRHISDPLATITGSREMYMAAFAKFNGGPADTAWHPVSDPLNTVTQRDSTGLMSGQEVDLDAVHFRMLHPEPELQRAMAFNDDYQLLGTKTQKTMGLGNAVTPPVADWLTEQVLRTLDEKGVTHHR